MHKELTEKAMQGEIHPSRRNNFLTMVIGTQAHPGRVRGCGWAGNFIEVLHEP